jgi:DNA-binding transcriptional LysR family regulator
MSELQVADDLRTARLYRLLPEYEPVRQQIYIVYPSRRYLAPRIRVMIDFLAEHVRRLTARDSSEHVGDDGSQRIAEMPQR